MEYKLKNNDDVIALEVAADGDDRITVSIGEKRFIAVYQRISDHQIHLIVDGRQTMAFVADTPGGKAVMVGGRTWLMADAAAQPSRRRGAGRNGPKDVTPPMPAVVTRILVAPGETVKKGQGVVVVSAMKMDMTLTAPFDGVVTRLNVAEGDKVAPGQVLVDIDPAVAEATAA